MYNPVLCWRRVVFALVLAVLAVISARAEEDLSQLSLDQLFVELKSAPNPNEAARISTRIWRKWLTPEDPVLAVLMNEAIAAKAALDISRTMTLLEQITANFPDYAEAWNLRATLQYELGNYEKSLSDIEETLRREPRHYGALSGRALVYLALGDKLKARQAVEEALEIHPFIAENPPLSDLVEPVVHV